MKALVETNTRNLSIAILAIRIMTGLILFVAGAGKVMGWFDGFGMTTTLQMFKSGMNISSFWAYVSCYAEFLGGALLIIGLFTRPAALILTINMLVAVYFVGFKNFFLGGAAYPFLLMICFAAILLAGPTRYSIDYLLFSKKDSTPRAKTKWTLAL